MTHTGKEVQFLNADYSGLKNKVVCRRAYVRLRSKKAGGYGGNRKWMER